MSAIFPEGFDDIARREGASTTAHDVLGIIERAIEDDTDWGCVILEIIRYCREVRKECNPDV